MRSWSVLWAIVLVACSRWRAEFPPDRDLFGVARPADHRSFEETGSRAIARAAQSYPAASVPAPVSLTASDGSGLELVRYRARVFVEGPLAFTELHLGFRNPEARRLEGRFRVRLAPEAAISRLAMRIGDAWQEAEVVERAESQAVYEGYLRRRQDPALLEQSAGNEHEVRVFPIEPSSTKEIIVSYSERLAERDLVYRLALEGLPRIEHFDLLLRARSDSGKLSTFKLRREGFEPDRDFAQALPTTAGALRAADVLVARVLPVAASIPAPLDELTILFDTSASRARGFEQKVADLFALLAALRARGAERTRLSLIAFDQGSELLFRGRLGEIGDESRTCLLARRPLGATDLGAALEALDPKLGGRLLVIGDGIATGGETEAAALVRVATKLASRLRRLDYVLAGGATDPALARGLATLALPEPGFVFDGDERPERIAERLGQRPLPELRVKVEGAEAVFPGRVRGLAAGDPLLVFARLGPEPVAPFIELSGGVEQRFALKPVDVEAPLLERELARAEIEELDRALVQLKPGEARAERDLLERIVELSKTSRVLTPYTALLVLESDAEYVRHGLDRAATRDILVVGERGVEVSEPASEDEETEARASARLRRARGDSESNWNAPPPRPLRSAQKSATRARRAPGLAPPALTSRRNLLSAQRNLLDQPIDSSRADAEREPSKRKQPVRFSGPAAHAGRYADVMAQIARGELEEAVVSALEWVADRPHYLPALVALGQALEAGGERVLAARAYGSLVDLYPSRAELRRFAAACLERLGPHGLPLAVDAYQKARSLRPDQVTGYHLLALALARARRFAEAFDILEAGLLEERVQLGNASAYQVLRHDLTLIAAGWIHQAPDARGRILDRLEPHGLALSYVPTAKFVLTWETGANDMDLHVVDEEGQHVEPGQPALEGGERILEDVADGYGPEAFDVPLARSGRKYRLVVNYAARGAMGHGMGKIDVMAQDTKGRLVIESQPFLIMNDGAYLELGWAKLR